MMLVLLLIVLAVLLAALSGVGGPGWYRRRPGARRHVVRETVSDRGPYDRAVYDERPVVVDEAPGPLTVVEEPTPPPRVVEVEEARPVVTRRRRRIIEY